MPIILFHQWFFGTVVSLVEDVPHTLDTFWLGFHMNESDGGGTLYPLGFIL